MATENKGIEMEMNVTKVKAKLRVLNQLKSGGNS